MRDFTVAFTEQELLDVRMALAVRLDDLDREVDSAQVARLDALLKMLSRVAVLGHA